MVTIVDYDLLNQALNEAKSPCSAAMAHGMVCGFIAAGINMDGKTWIESIISNHKITKNMFGTLRESLIALYESSNLKLQDIEFDFDLLLPSDDAPLSERAAALSYWCEGFITALDSSGIKYPQGFSTDCSEAIYHMMEIAKLDYESIEITDEDEHAYIEVMEYVRVAVLMVYTEMSHQQDRGGNLSSRRLH